MKPGRRALGVAESYRGTDDGTYRGADTDASARADTDGNPPGSDSPTRSTLGGAVVRADGRVDDFVFGTCTVGGLDATDAVADCWRRLDRPDVRYLFLAGVALAWYNVLDLSRLHDVVERPVVAVSFEDSDGLTPAIEAAFDGDAREERLAAYERLPPRRRLHRDGPDLFVRSVGLDDDAADQAVRAYTHDGRPEPLHVANRAARAVDDFRRD